MFVQMKQVQTLEQLLQGFDEEDAEMAASALNSPFIKHMDVEYARLARDLPLPKGLAPISKASVIENAAPSYISPNAKQSGVSLHIIIVILKSQTVFVE